MSVKLFVTGTDTGIGKTYVSVGLLNAFNQRGYSTIGLKPVAAGAMEINDELFNEDALELNKASSIKLTYQQTNPILYKPFIAPNIAALEAGTELSALEVIKKNQHSLQQQCDIHLVEGAGGWALPLNSHETMIDFVTHYKMTVVLVVGLRLGCLNHALLTYQAIKQANLPIGGWIVNSFEEDGLAAEGVIATLNQWLDAPYLGLVPYGKNPADVLEIKHLLNLSDRPLSHRRPKKLVVNLF
jgi:dethiobiotin synthetase